jgi:ribosomal-protein-alanine N-acetyltransferase
LCEGIVIRQGGEEDLARVAEIQRRSPEASQWEPRDYLAHDFRVAERGGRVEGFSVARRLLPDESELLNLAVDPDCRRRGVGTALARDLYARHPGCVYLEVRESNEAARKFYKTLGFKELAVRPHYYQNPAEGAVVMRLRSCYCHK